MAYTLPSLPNLNPYLQVFPPLPAKPMSKIGWLVGQVNSNAPPPSAKAGVTAYAPDAAASCVRLSIKPFLNTSVLVLSIVSLCCLVRGRHISLNHPRALQSMPQRIGRRCVCRKRCVIVTPECISLVRHCVSCLTSHHKQA